MPKEKISGSLYRNIELLDVRRDNLFMGTVQVGLLNSKAKVVSETPLAEQLQQVLDASVDTDSAAGNGKLLLRLRYFNFAELTAGFAEKGFCAINGTLFAQNGDAYQKVQAIDTVLQVKGMDATGPIMKAASLYMSNLIKNNLTWKPTDGNRNYTFEEVTKLDSVMKRSIPAYNMDSLRDGLYRTYESFSKQIPDQEIGVDVNTKGEVLSVKVMGDKGKLVKVKNKDMYAFVHKGVPYVVTEFGFYPLEKKDDDFYFVGRARTYVDSGDLFVSTFLFGIAGALITSGNSSDKFYLKIDYRKGGFEQIRRVTE